VEDEVILGEQLTEEPVPARPRGVQVRFKTREAPWSKGQIVRLPQAEAVKFVERAGVAEYVH
jgi:hypothetical protein